MESTSHASRSYIYCTSTGGGMQERKGHSIHRQDGYVIDNTNDPEVRILEIIGVDNTQQ